MSEVGDGSGVSNCEWSLQFPRFPAYNPCITAIPTRTTLPLRIEVDAPSLPDLTRQPFGSQWEDQKYSNQFLEARVRVLGTAQLQNKPLGALSSRRPSLASVEITLINASTSGRDP